MNIFNFFNPDAIQTKLVDAEMIQNNLDLKAQFVKLSASQSKLLINKSSSNERSVLLKIIKTNGNTYVSKELHKKLEDKLRESTKLRVKNTRKEDSRSSFAKLKKGTGRLIGNMGYIFNVLTADKAQRLIKTELLKQNFTYHLPQISYKKLEKLLIEARQNTLAGEKVNLAKVLKENGFSSEIKNMHLPNKFSLNNTQLTGITFTNCTFDWTQCSDSHLQDVVFNSCDIGNLSLMNSELKNCHFDNCDMREVMFTGANLTDVTFTRSSLISSSFEDASLTNCIFKTVSMPATHFLEATIKDSHIFSSELRDTVFFGTLSQFTVDDQTRQTAVVTRPTTAILVHPAFRGITSPKAFMKVDQSAKNIGLRITMQPQKSRKDGVNKEVEAALSRIGPNDKNRPPIARQLIEELAQNPASESFKILQKVEKLTQEVDSFFLPGGEDLPSSLYGQEKEEKTDWGDDYRRSILELGIIHQSFNKGIPLMAVCRGFQMAHVYFGAQLVQDVSGHTELQTLELSTPEKRGLYAMVMKHNIVSASGHHQAIPVESAATEHLQNAVLYKGIVKASELQESGTAPMVLLQFHPEAYKANTANTLNFDLMDRLLDVKLSKENELFWDILSDSANAYRTKQIVLQQIGAIREAPQAIRDKRMVKLHALEERQAKILDIYKKEHYSLKKGLFELVKNDPEKLLFRYLAPVEEGASDRFFEEREALEGALRHDAQFLNNLMNVSDKDRQNIIMAIHDANPTLYAELEKGPLQPYIH